MTDDNVVKLAQPAAGRLEFRQFRYVNRNPIVFPHGQRCFLSLHFLFNDMTQYQERYWPNTYPNSQPLCVSLLQGRSQCRICNIGKDWP